MANQTSKIPLAIRRVITEKIRPIEKGEEGYDIEEVVKKVNEISKKLNKIAGL